MLRRKRLAPLRFYVSGVILGIQLAASGRFVLPQSPTTTPLNRRVALAFGSATVRLVLLRATERANWVLRLVCLLRRYSVATPARAVDATSPSRRITFAGGFVLGGRAVALRDGLKPALAPRPFTVPS